MIPLLEKLEVLDMLDIGMRTDDVGHHFGVNKSTIYVTKKTEDEGKGSTKATGCEHFFSKPSKLLP
jgi:transposase